MSTAFRRLPSVDRLLQAEELRQLEGSYPRDRIVAAARDVLAGARAAIERGEPVPEIERLTRRVAERVADWFRPSLEPVINATGVIIHTNLGRAPLSAATRRAMSEVAAGYSNLEYELAAGARGSRHGHLRAILRELTGAGDAVAVNNNAAAVLIALAACAAGREVIVSRGEAVEIGGGFRIPDVLAQSGARLVEVGTTNRTYVADYERAITDQTAAILRVHTSNFRIIGFVHQPDLADLTDLARRRGLAVIDDLGSGCLIDPRPFGLLGEPLVQDSVAAGVSLTCFSGDKLLGGPQAGVIVGQPEYVRRIREHPLMRAVRPDKTTIAGLTATLHHYLLGEALREVPVWRMIATPVTALEERARSWQTAVGHGELVSIRSTVGGGSLPEETLPSRGLAIDWTEGPDRLAERLRAGSPPVIARISEDRLVLDPRTVLPDQDDRLVMALRRVLTSQDKELVANSP